MESIPKRTCLLTVYKQMPQGLALRWTKGTGGQGKSLFLTADIKSFFSEVGGSRSSRLSRILYIALHDSEQVEVGGVTGSLEFSCNSFFQFCGIES